MCCAFILLKKALFFKDHEPPGTFLFLIRNMPAVCTGRSYFWNFMIHLNRAAIKNRVEFSGHQSVQSEDRRSDPVYQPAPDRISGRRFSLFPGLSEQILYDAPLQSGNRIYHRKLYHLPQAFACPHFDPGWDADHAGLPCKRLSGLLHIFTSLQNRISRTTQNAFTSL